ncbi:hypothetical protein GQ53DRAFT_798556 [Thozetella sp. PMI_491]|nr:hypothetical protein GQ53DRAFT_798556 [Thozetella sp. PMI_491]
MKYLTTVTGLLALVGRSLQGGVLRFGCSQIVIERLDPLVTPGDNPSPHVHQIVGGNAFAATIPQSDVAQLANCTTCSYAEDFSNYWTANMYFRAQNGSYKRVPQKPNRYLQGASGGITVYYVAPYDNSKVTAFKPGFRMLVGDVSLREAKGIGRAICFRCFTGPNWEGDNAAPCADPKLDTTHLPTQACPGGIRSNVQFPTCWDGRNLDSPNHKDHVAYPLNGTFASGGPCPATHPVKIPQIFLEVVWDTAQFNDAGLWPADGSQPFFLSMGDKTGYGQHADYVFGWKGDSLQRAMENPKCVAANCPELTTQSFVDANKCRVPITVPEKVDGWLESLPGGGKGM